MILTRGGFRKFARGGPGKIFDNLPHKSACVTHFSRNIPKIVNSWQQKGVPLDHPNPPLLILINSVSLTFRTHFDVQVHCWHIHKTVTCSIRVIVLEHTSCLMYRYEKSWNVPRPVRRSCLYFWLSLRQWVEVKSLIWNKCLVDLIFGRRNSQPW